MKFKLKVEKVFYKEVVVNADDYDHAIEIAKEVDDFMDCDYKTFTESNRKAELVDDSYKVTYEPENEYLK